MRSYANAVAYAEQQRKAPTRDWTYLCQKFARTCVGAAAWGSTALKAWYAIPVSHRHGGTPPPGSLVYFDDPNRVGEAGHVVFMVTNGYCYSNDILRRGKIDKVPLSLIRTKWGMRQLGWIDWTPSGSLNLLKTLPTVDLSRAQDAARLDPPAPSGTYTYRPGVLLIERGLVKLGYLDPRWSDGHFGTSTVDGYKKFQRSLGLTATGKPTSTDLKALGRKTGFQVVA